MVKRIHLQELIKISDLTQRNTAIRRAFTSYTDSIDVTGCETNALIVLLNLTLKRVSVEDLLDKSLAKKTLLNTTHFDKCIDEIRWFHTHNLKFPDIRVSMQNLVAMPTMLHSKVITSANYKQGLGWSHDAAKVNLAKLFVSPVYWNGGDTNLASLLTLRASDWKLAFRSLGMREDAYKQLCNRVSIMLEQGAIPDKVDRHSRQVLFPYHDSYISITPVVSHVLQSKLQQAAIKKLGKFSHLEFVRPAAVSELVSSLGGMVNVLHYPPNVYQQRYNLHQSRLNKVLTNQSILNDRVLSSSAFIRALNGLVSIKKELALKQRRKTRVESVKQIRSSLSEWIAPLFEWRIEFLDNIEKVESIQDIEGTLTHRFLTLSDTELPSLAAELSRVLNSTLSNNRVTMKYAFHPKLMSSLKSVIAWLLKPRNDEGVNQKELEKGARYLHLKQLRGFDIGALSNPYCAGLPSLTAIWGMLHRYQREINKHLGTSIRLISFAWFIRDYDEVKGKQLPEMMVRPEKQNKLIRPGIVDSKHCDMIFDLVVCIDGYEDDLTLLDKQRGILKASFPSNFAGGVVLQPSLDSEMNWCNLYQSKAQLFELLKRLPLSGKWIVPTSHKYQTIEELLTLLNSFSDLSATMMGYVLLDQPKCREGALRALHSYAEPAIGIVECKTAIQVRFCGESSFFNRAFWMLDAQENYMIMTRA